MRPKGSTKKGFFDTASPYLRVWMTPPPPLSEGLDPQLTWNKSRGPRKVTNQLLFHKLIDGSHNLLLQEVWQTPTSLFCKLSIKAPKGVGSKIFVFLTYIRILPVAPYSVNVINWKDSPFGNSYHIKTWKRKDEPGFHYLQWELFCVKRG